MMNQYVKGWPMAGGSVIERGMPEAISNDKNAALS